MSILFQYNDCSLIDHREYTLNMYEKVLMFDEDEEQTLNFALVAKLFSILRNTIQATRRKRIHNSEDILEDATFIMRIYERFKHEIPTEVKLKIQKYHLLHTSSVRDLSMQLFESTVFDHSGLNGGNNSHKPMRCKVKAECFLIPRQSRFFCGCVKEQCKKLDGSFDIVIADPPWWNKYIRRLKRANDKLSYSMMYNEDIASIPIKDLLSPNCLIAVWCTNAPSNIAAVKELIFPNWGVEYITTWYWLKVTTDLEAMYDFGVGCKKQPYERIILGKVGNLKEMPERHLVVSVPSALHSHKPPMLDLLSPYVNVENPRTLELFARYLLPNTTSIGFEPLKWQHISLYETVSE